MSKYDEVYNRLRTMIAGAPEHLDDWLGDQKALRTTLLAMHKEGLIPRSSYDWIGLVLRVCEDIDRRQRARAGKSAGTTLTGSVRAPG